MPLAFISQKRVYFSIRPTEIRRERREPDCCLTQNLLERSPQHVLQLRIAVRVGTINFSLVESELFSLIFIFLCE